MATEEWREVTHSRLDLLIVVLKSVALRMT